MKLTNTLTRKKQPFKPLRPGQVKLYTCGPTVYDSPHIGNWRSFVFYDTLRRTLESNGYKVDHVMNITDVGHLTSDADEGEDKLEAGARRENKTASEVAEFYTNEFMRGLTQLNLRKPTQLLKATETIDSQIELVQILVERGFAYQTQHAVYFDITRFPNYGLLSGQKLSEKEVGVRPGVIEDPDKKHPFDFALWLFTVGRHEHHQLRWPSPWGEGFPGWHLECSAIIHRALGETIDIHTGGVDHIGTHHENEIAQSEAAFGKPLANFWLHNEFLTVNGQKMSKSTGDYVTLDKVTEKGFSPMSLRLLYLQSHYRSHQNFTWEALTAAENFLADIYAWADLKHQDQPAASIWLGDFESAMSEDLNSPQALAVLSRHMEEAPSGQTLAQIEAYLGLGLNQRPDITPEQKAILSERQKARDAGDFQAADKARSRLADQNIAVLDTPAGPRWRRIQPIA